jgi:hypothetical protein
MIRNLSKRVYLNSMDTLPSSPNVLTWKELAANTFVLPPRMEQGWLPGETSRKVLNFVATSELYMMLHTTLPGTTVSRWVFVVKLAYTSTPLNFPMAFR